MNVTNFYSRCDTAMPSLDISTNIESEMGLSLGLTLKWILLFFMCPSAMKLPHDLERKLFYVSFGCYLSSWRTSLAAVRKRLSSIPGDTDALPEGCGNWPSFTARWWWFVQNSQASSIKDQFAFEGRSSLKYKVVSSYARCWIHLGPMLPSLVSC